MHESTPFDIDQLFTGSLIRLRTEAEYFSRLTGHDPELGRLNETHLVNLLRAYLPPKIGIGTGFLASGGTEPRQSPQCDIVLYDNLSNSALYRSDVWSIFPIEMVYAVIEVKTTLRKRDLVDAFKKCAIIRSMATTKDGQPNKSYLKQLPPKPNTPASYVELRSALPPRFFIFGYNGWMTMDGLRRNFIQVSEEFKSAHVHGVCSLANEQSHYISHKAFARGNDRFFSVENNGFRFFLMNLPIKLDGMLSIDRNGLGFDQFNISHYALGLDW